MANLFVFGQSYGGTIKANGQQMMPKEKIVGADLKGLTDGKVLRLDSVAFQNKMLLERLYDVFESLNEYNNFLVGKLRLGDSLVMELPIPELQAYTADKTSTLSIIYTLNKIDEKYAFLDLSIQMPDVEFKTGVTAQMKGSGGVRYDIGAKYFDQNKTSLEMIFTEGKNSLEIISDVEMNTKISNVK